MSWVSIHTRSMAVVCAVEGGLSRRRRTLTDPSFRRRTRAHRRTAMDAQARHLRARVKDRTRLLQSTPRSLRGISFPHPISLRTRIETRHHVQRRRDDLRHLHQLLHRLHCTSFEAGFLLPMWVLSLETEEGELCFSPERSTCLMLTPSLLPLFRSSHPTIRRSQQEGSSSTYLPYLD